MKASPNPQHPWYRDDAQDFSPYVNGGFVENVIAASEEDGRAFVLDVDAWGNLPPEAGEVPTYEVRGRVELVTWEEHRRRQRAQAA